MATAMKQFCLSAKGCSGRGVRMRMLDPILRQTIKDEAAKDLGPDATVAQWEAKQGVAGIVATVLEITDKSGYANAAALVGDVAWKKVSDDHLQEHLADYFNAKDLDALVKIFRKLHDVEAKEVDDILGEALDVTAD